MSSSDDSDDEKLKQVIASTDINFLSDNLYKEKREDTQETVLPSPTHPKSGRHINAEDVNFDTDLKIPITTQLYVAKKLSELIANQIKFVTPKHPTKLSANKDRSTLKLLKDFEVCLDVDHDDTLYPKLKPIILKRKFEQDPDDHISANDKLKLVSVEPDFILNRVDVKNWSERKKSKIFRYKSKSGNPYQFVEDDNEFSTRKRKNNWSYKKICLGSKPK